MIRFFPILIFIFFAIQVSAQQRYYIFIQSEGQASFFIKKDNKIQNSAPGGYVILSGLSETNHEFSVGFNGINETDQHFKIDLKGKDRSYLLKKMEDRKWGLFDLQELSISYATKGEQNFKLKPENEVSSFTNLLVQASGDSTLKYTAVVSKKEEPKVVSNKAESVTQSKPIQKINEIENKTTEIKSVDSKNVDASMANANNNEKQTLDSKEIIQDEIIQPKMESSPVVNKPDETKKDMDVGLIKNEGLIDDSSAKDSYKNYQPLKVLKVSETITDKGLNIVYKEILPGGKEDTILVMIDDFRAPDKENITGNLNEKNKEDASVEFSQTTISDKKSQDNTNKETVPAKILKFLNVNTKKDNTEQPDAARNNVKVDNPSNCKEKASDKDLSRLRNKMALAVTDETMITEAKSLFEKKCLTSSQVKRLGDLFVTNAGKFSFFKTVYPFVSDKQYFYTLQNELTDEHYNSRFTDILQSR